MERNYVTVITLCIAVREVNATGLTAVSLFIYHNNNNNKQICIAS